MSRRPYATARLTVGDGFRVGVGIAFWFAAFIGLPWMLLILVLGVAGA